MVSGFNIGKIMGNEVLRSKMFLMNNWIPSKLPLGSKSICTSSGNGSISVR